MKNRCSILHEFQNIYGFMKLIKCYNKENMLIIIWHYYSYWNDMKHSQLVLNRNGDGIFQ